MNRSQELLEEMDTEKEDPKGEGEEETDKKKKKKKKEDEKDDLFKKKKEDEKEEETLNPSQELLAELK